MSEKEFSRNKKQINFNQIKGTVQEIVYDNSHAIIVLEVVPEVPRNVAISCVLEKLNSMGRPAIGEKVCVHYFPSSKLKNGFWYSKLNLLAINKDASA